MKEIRKVSVVLCTYNGELYIREQLDSIINQTYPIYEIIIQDDHSSDKTWEIVNSYQSKYNHIKCYRNDCNIGVHKNFMTAYLKAIGDYIAPSDQDDIWKLNKIEFLVNLIDDKLLAYSQSEIRYMDSKFQNSFILRSPYVTFEKLIYDNRFPGHATLFSKKIQKYINQALTIYNLNVNVTQSNAHDHIAPIVAFALGSYKITDEILQIWRRHPNVCNLQFVNYKNELPIKIKKSGYKKSILTILLLAKGVYSNSIADTFSAMSKLLNFIEEQNRNNDNRLTKLLGKLTNCISKQTIFSFIMAGYISVKIRYNKQDKNNLWSRAIQISYAFRFPFIYWYDMHKVKYL